MQVRHNFKKQFGQNFLKHEHWALKMVKTANITAKEKVIEIGPGQGILTNILLKQQAQVYSVEIDHELIPLLSQKFNNYPNFQIIEEDILQLEIDNAGQKQYKVIGSLPYNIAKKIIEKFLTANNKPQSMTFIIQKEVADEYLKLAPKASALGVISSIYADVKLISIIKNSEFYPKPKVDGGLIYFTNICPKYDNPSALSKFIRRGFKQPRKKLSVNLATTNIQKSVVENTLLELGLSINSRAGELTLANWDKLFKSCPLI